MGEGRARVREGAGGTVSGTGWERVGRGGRGLGEGRDRVRMGVG